MSRAMTAAEPLTTDFDPLVELYGMWTTGLADRYLPIENAPLIGKYECLDGFLVMSRRESSWHSHAAAELGSVLRDPACAADRRAYLALSVVIHPDRWIEPELVVLKEPVKRLTWVSVDQVLMTVELVPRLGWRRVDQAALCAGAGVPYFMRVMISDYGARVELLKLVDGSYVMHAKALSGQTLETELPFQLAFDPAVLLEP